MKVKRWLFLFWIGLTIFSIGLILYTQITPFIEMEMWVVNLIHQLTGQVVKSQVVDLALILIGLILIIISVRQWFMSIYRTVMPNQSRDLVDVMYEKHHLRHGSRILTIGGGTGLSSLLRGLKKYTTNTTAVVTVADDGGSSGRLRKEMGVLPPGDIRNCLVALADEENLMGDLFQFRFADGESLEGHNFGNLFLVAMTSITGDFDQAIKQSSKILAIQGRVLPATLSPVTLCAIMEDGRVVEGESSITNDGQKIQKVYLKPSSISPPEEVMEAIMDAELIIMGPGSLYTSVLPNLIMKGMVSAINRASAPKVYVCNVMTQPGETDGFKASDHLRALLDQATGLKIDYCLVNNQDPPSELVEKYEEKNQYPVKPDLENIEKMGITPITASLISTADLVRHNPEKLAERIVKLMEENKQKK
ncbi:MAG: uridine diphosphate-N-acetylglucosamine-binding protein YvcK [Vulcanimicrobiota bacterium]